jgi:hypothetical protein
LLTRLINTYTKWAKYDASYQTNQYNSDRPDSEKSDDYDSDNTRVRRVISRKLVRTMHVGAYAAE